MIFIRYFECFKKHVFIGEHTDESVSELESRDITFMENEFLNIREVSKNISFMENEFLSIREVGKNISLCKLDSPLDYVTFNMGVDGNTRFIERKMINKWKED